jgi:4-hydroxy-4-methyl-2-oxoglutarate aldolase
MEPQPLGSAQLDALRKFDTCIVASAIAAFRVRLQNAGFADSSIRCMFADLPPMLGYATTARVRSADPPMEGGRYDYYHRPDWWRHILTLPAPRVVVIEDIDNRPGLGAFVGAVHANILLALGCVGLVTNGTVRDIPDVRPTGFQMFACDVSVSHAYAHLFDFGRTVRVGGMTVKPGDLIQGDLHGVQTIPLEIAAKIPPVATEIQQRRQFLIDLCRSRDFSLEKLIQAIEGTEGKGPKP